MVGVCSLAGMWDAKVVSFNAFCLPSSSSRRFSQTCGWSAVRDVRKSVSVSVFFSITLWTSLRTDKNKTLRHPILNHIFSSPALHSLSLRGTKKSNNRTGNTWYWVVLSVLCINWPNVHPHRTASMAADSSSLPKSCECEWIICVHIIAACQKRPWI